MKKITSLLLVLSLVVLCTLCVSADECAHSYTSVHNAASCTEKAHTLYTCSLCADSYKVYDSDYTAPDGFYILCESQREASTLKVTLTFFNNPGIVAGRLKVGYNSDTLAAREFINGTVWSDNDYTATVKLGNNPFTVLTEDYTTNNHCNTSNGTYFTVVFDILDPDGDYGITFTRANADFHNWDLVPQPPAIVDVIGTEELGDHSYTVTHVPPTCTEGGYDVSVCTVCNDTFSTSTDEPTGHRWEFSCRISEPTFTSEGLDEYRCTECGEEKTESVPVLLHWEKGDLNGDGKINAIDANVMKRIIVGMSSGLQAEDAADLDENGAINSIDSSLLQRKLAGLI